MSGAYMPACPACGSVGLGECPGPEPQDKYSGAIDLAQPLRSGTPAHKAYVEAVEMVGKRHSRGALVALVTWLVLERDKAHATQAWQQRAHKHATDIIRRRDETIVELEAKLDAWLRKVQP